MTDNLTGNEHTLVGYFAGLQCCVPSCQHNMVAVPSHHIHGLIGSIKKGGLVRQVESI